MNTDKAKIPMGFFWVLAQRGEDAQKNKTACPRRDTKRHKETLLRVAPRPLALSLLFCLLLGGAAPPATAGTIRGVVQKEGRPVAGADVELEQLSRTERRLGTRKTGADGAFEFGDLETVPGSVYRLHYRFQDVPYETEVIALHGPNTQRRLDLTVYDVVKKVPTIEYVERHLLFQPENDSVHVRDEWIVRSREEDRVVKPTQPLRFRLPASYRDFRKQVGFRGCCTELKESALYATTYLYPGFNELSFTYHLPAGEFAHFRETLPVDLGFLFVFLPTRVSGLSHEGFLAEEELDVEGVNYKVLQAEQMRKGQTFAVRFRLRPWWEGRWAYLPLALGFLLLSTLLRPGPRRSRKHRPNAEALARIALLEEEGLIDAAEARRREKQAWAAGSAREGGYRSVTQDG